MDILASNQAREERKLEKQLHKLQHHLKRNTSRSESFGDSTAGAKDRKETGDVCGCESEDFKGNKRAMGKV